MWLKSHIFTFYVLRNDNEKTNHFQINTTKREKYILYLSNLRIDLILNITINITVRNNLLRRLLFNYNRCRRDSWTFLIFLLPVWPIQILIQLNENSNHLNYASSRHDVLTIIINWENKLQPYEIFNSNSNNDFLITIKMIVIAKFLNFSFYQLVSPDKHKKWNKSNLKTGQSVKYYFNSTRVWISFIITCIVLFLNEKLCPKKIMLWITNQEF